MALEEHPFTLIGLPSFLQQRGRQKQHAHVVQQPRTDEQRGVGLGPASWPWRTSKSTKATLRLFDGMDVVYALPSRNTRNRPQGSVLNDAEDAEAALPSNAVIEKVSLWMSMKCFCTSSRSWWYTATPSARRREELPVRDMSGLPARGTFVLMIFIVMINSGEKLGKKSAECLSGIHDPSGSWKQQRSQRLVQFPGTQATREFTRRACPLALNRIKGAG